MCVGILYLFKRKYKQKYHGGTAEFSVRRSTRSIKFLDLARVLKSHPIDKYANAIYP